MENMKLRCLTIKMRGEDSVAATACNVAVAVVATMVVEAHLHGLRTLNVSEAVAAMYTHLEVKGSGLDHEQLCC